MVEIYVSRYRRFFLFLTLAAVVAAPAFAQGELLWVKTSILSLDFDQNRGERVAVDASGSAIFTGRFLGAIDFGGGSFLSSPTGDAFVAKYTSSGSHAWSFQIPATSFVNGTGVAVDSLGDIIISGYFLGTIDLGSGQFSSTGNSPPDFDGYVAKYDNGGNPIWSRKVGGPRLLNLVRVAVDSLGNVVVTGGFSGAADFGGGSIAAAGVIDGFIVKYDSDGNLLWARTFSAGDVSRGMDVATDPFDNIVIVGQGSTGTSSGTLIAKYDPDGNSIWSRLTSAPGFGTGVAVDALGDIAITGEFSGTANFGGGSILSEGGSDAFLAKYDANGNHMWSRGFGGAGDDSGNAVAFDTLANVLVTGAFENASDFGGGQIDSNGASDIFIAEFDSMGDHLWSRGVGGVNVDNGAGIAADPSGNALVTGFFRVNADFGAGLVSGPAQINFFTAKYTGDPLLAASAAAGGSGGCFIATATYGTPMAEDIDTLRNFRDAYLLNNTLGAAFADAYYRISPPIAAAVSQSPWPRTLVRACLTPIVLLSKMLMANPRATLTFAILTLALAIAFATRDTRRTEKAKVPGVH